MAISENPNEKDSLTAKKKAPSKKTSKSKLSLHPFVVNVIENSNEIYHKKLIKVHQLVELEILNAKRMGVPNSEDLYPEIFKRLLRVETLKLNSDFSVGPLFDFKLYNPNEQLRFTYEEKQYRRNRKKVNHLNTYSLDEAIKDTRLEVKGKEKVHEFRIRKSATSNPDRDKVVYISTSIYNLLVKLNGLTSPTYHENYTNDIEEFSNKLLEYITKFTGEVFTQKEFKSFLTDEVENVNVELRELYTKLYNKLNIPLENSPIGDEIYRFTVDKESKEFVELVKNRDINFSQFENRLAYLHMLIAK